MRLSFIFISFLFSFQLFAQPFQFDSTRFVGGDNADNVGALVIDDNKNVIVIGRFNSDTVFIHQDTSLVGPIGATSGTMSSFLTKYDSIGNHLFTKRFPLHSLYSIAIGNNNDIYLTGSNQSGMILYRLDSTATEIWSQNANGSWATSVCFDKVNDKVLITGLVANASSIQFDSLYITSQNGNHDLFIASYFESGGIDWIRVSRGFCTVYSGILVTDSLGDIYMSGQFYAGSFTIDAPNAFYISGANYFDAVLFKLNSEGTGQWIKKIGGNGRDYIGDMEINSNNDILIGFNYATSPGYYEGELLDNSRDAAASLLLLDDDNGDLLEDWSMYNGSFCYINDSTLHKALQIDDQDVTLGFVNYQAIDWWDSYIIEFDLASDAVIFSQQIAGTGPDGIAVFAYDEERQRSYIGGYYSSDDFTVGNYPSPHEGLYSGSKEGFFTSGKFVANCLDLPNDTTLYIEACNEYLFHDRLLTESGIYIDSLIKQGCDTVVTLNLYIFPPDSVVDSYVVCDSLTWSNGITYYSSNYSAVDSLLNHCGQDSILYLDLTILENTYSVDSIVNCDSLLWIDGISYYESTNSPSFISTNTQGCDSIIYLDLTILENSFSTDILEACDSLQWIDGIIYYESTSTPTYMISNSTGCDSIITLNLTVLHSNYSTDSILSFEEYTWIDGNTYFESNYTSTMTYASSNGCDSIVSLHLEILQLNVETIVNGTTITALAEGAAYQWLDCNNNYIAIDEETGQSYIALNNGDYAVKVTQFGATDTSLCVSINSVGISETDILENISVYPNPSNDVVNIEFDKVENASLKVYNSQGQLIYSEESINESLYHFNLQGPPGIYYLEIRQDGSQKRVKLIKK